MEFFGLTQTNHWWVFFALVFGIIVLPGLDMAYVMASALVGGRKAGLAAVAGITAGGMVHVLMGVVGVGLVLKTMPQVFNLMLLAGSAYVAWMGWSLLRGASTLGETSAPSPGFARPPEGAEARGSQAACAAWDGPKSPCLRQGLEQSFSGRPGGRLEREGQARGAASIFGRAAATCLMNPKAYVFMLAVFPQFLRADYGPLVPQALGLGAIICATQVAVYGAVAMGASRMRLWLRSNQRKQVRLGQAVGLLLLVASLWTGWQGWRVA